MADSLNINLSALDRSGGNSTALLHSLSRGKNWMGGPPKVPTLRDNPGLVFLTKPDFNLSKYNIGGIRQFDPLLNTNPFSMGAMLRDCLDPRSVHRTGVKNSYINDPLNPFFSVLDNTCLQLDGWNDYVSDSYISKPGKRGSTYGLPSGSIRDAGEVPLTSTHTNLPGDVINNIITYWQLWNYHVMKRLSPHPIHVMKDQFGGTARWYRFVFDEQRTKVNQFTMCGYCYPSAGNQGAVMNYDARAAINEGYSEVSVRWQAFGLFHNDPIVIDEFNRTVSNFNPLMLDENRETYMIKLGGANRPSLPNAGPFTGYGYPRINPYTMEFEVWVTKNDYGLIINDASLDEVIAQVREDSNANFDAAIAQLTPEERRALYGAG